MYMYYIHCLYMDNIDMFKAVHIQWNTFYYEPLINNIISGIIVIHFNSLCVSLICCSISLNNLVAHQFPLKSSELPVGSPMYNEYIMILDKVH